jgi:hypothetical protein
MPLTENFLTTINQCESLDELYELLLKIEEEILKTRSNDTGGQNGNFNLVNLKVILCPILILKIFI